MNESTRPFAESTYQDRRVRLQEAVRAQGLSGLVLVGKPNRVYLTGFGPEAGNLSRFVALCLPAEGEPLYILSDLDQERAAGLPMPIAPVAYGQGLKVATQTVARWPAGPIGIEAGTMSLLVADALREATGRDLRPADGLVGRLRMVKSDAEIAILRQAAAFTDAVAEFARAHAAAGVSERDLAGGMVHEALRLGCDMPNMPFVLTGERAMMPHLRPSQRTFQRGELVVIDYGVGFGGYETDICRTFAVGEPGATARRLHAVVGEAFAAAVAAAVPGNRACDVHQAAHDVIAKAGYGDYFIHGVGHGVGVQSHEAPLLAFGYEDVLEEGMVLAIEPGIYTEGIGLRLEDDVVVRPGGGESLNQAPKGL